MQLMNHARVQIVSVAALLAMGPLLVGCAANPASATYISRLTGSANPVGVQTGRLVVIAIDSADGGPLMRATVDVVAADATTRDPTYYRRAGVADRGGMVTFNDVPKLVNVVIRHARGDYALENYIVPQYGTTEFRVYVDTQGPRTRDECLIFLACNP